MYQVLFVGLGSFLGGVLRYLVSQYACGQVSKGDFPWATFAVNVLGCFLIGLLSGILDRMNIMNPNVRLFLTVGFCGGFTTFSTFINESFTLLRVEAMLVSVLYVCSSLVCGLLALWLSSSLVRAI